MSSKHNVSIRRNKNVRIRRFYMAYIYISKLNTTYSFQMTELTSAFANDSV